jgi:hypothetical protein
MTPTMTEHGPVTCLSMSGLGEPGGAEHLAAIQALHTLAAVMAVDHGPLEGQWWVEAEQYGLDVPREQWRWHLLLPLSAAPEAGAVEQAREAARTSCRAVDRVRLATITEGRCVEVLHEGPFSEEHLSLKVMAEFMAERGLVPNGLHHEIYLTAFDDPAPRTLLRQPVRAA